MITPFDIDKNSDNWFRLQCAHEIYFIHTPSEKIWMNLPGFPEPYEITNDTFIIVEGKGFYDIDSLTAISKSRIQEIKQEILQEIKKTEEQV